MPSIPDIHLYCRLCKQKPSPPDGSMERALDDNGLCSACRGTATFTCSACLMRKPIKECQPFSGYLCTSCYNQKEQERTLPKQTDEPPSGHAYNTIYDPPYGNPNAEPTQSTAKRIHTCCVCGINLVYGVHGFHDAPTDKTYCAMHAPQRAIPMETHPSVSADQPQYKFTYDPLKTPTGDESDPHGTDAHAPGAKLDAGKPQVSLVLHGFGRALLEVAKVSTYGANKYSPNGWAQVPDGVQRYTDALGRHLLKEGFEKIDRDSGLSHAAQVAWNALARLELELRQEEKL